jgi:predicted Zn-dependent protease
VTRGKSPRLAIVAAVVLSGCVGSGPARPPALIPAHAWQELAAARGLADDGESERAEQKLRELVRAHPRFISAHRAWQNALLADHRRGELLAIYGDLLDGDPQDPERWYLLGRIQTSAAAQRSAFGRALALDPQSPWPRFGQAMLDHGSGAGGSAREALEQLCETAPGIPDFELGRIRASLGDAAALARVAPLAEGALLDETWDVERLLLLAECRERSGRSRDALELVGRLFARAPRNESVARNLLKRLEAGGTVADAGWLARELALVSESPLPALVLARCHALQGDAAAALAAWGRAPALDARTRELRRILLNVIGEPCRALEAETDRFSALVELGADVRAHAAARRDAEALEARSRNGGVDATAERVALARSLLSLGRVQEAAIILRPTRTSDDPSAAALRLRLEQQRHVEAELKVLSIENYRRELERAGTGAGLTELLAAIDAALSRTPIVPPIAPAPRRRFWPLGELVEPDATGLPSWFGEGGQLLVAGQRRGHPAELFLAPVMATGVAGPQDARLHWIEGAAIPGWLEHQGARFAGAALDRFAWIDVAAVEDQVDEMLGFEARFAGRRERLYADPVQSAADRSTRRSIDEPGELAAKLTMRALDAIRHQAPSGGRRAVLVAALDAVLIHETAHLADAAQFLPLWKNGWSVLPRAAALGFSPRRIEEWLELRAQCAALAAARNPWLPLCDCAMALSGGGRDGLTPHGDGYRELLAGLVAVIDDSPEDFSELDFSRVLLQQLDRLSEAKVRLAARRLAADLDLDLDLALAGDPGDVTSGVSLPLVGAR